MITDIVRELRGIEYKRRVQRLKHTPKQQLVKGNRHMERHEPIHIVYVLSHVSVCGGVKIILEHANGLQALGAQVTLISHFPKPEWFDIKANYVKVPFEIELSRYIPACDVIVATYWEHINACVEMGIAPVVYFEQGDFHLFEDQIQEEVKQTVYDQYQLPFKIMAVSEQISKIILKKFNRESIVCQNALNNEIFFGKKSSSLKKSMIIVGSEQVAFKGIQDLKKIYKALLAKGYDLDLIWITQHEPTEPMGRVYVSPTQEKIGELFREAFVYVSGSYYESFPLPPLEAMACGTPVVTTNNVGVLEYGEDNYNCLLSDVGNCEQLLTNVVALLEDSKLYSKLQRNGYKTSEKFQWDIILSELLVFYENVSEYEVPRLNNIEEVWEISDRLSLLADQATEKKLGDFLEHSLANEVYVPVEYKWDERNKIIRWERWAYRRQAIESGYTDEFPAVIAGGDLSESLFNEAIMHIKDENYTVALRLLKDILINLDFNSANYAVGMRWVIQCYMKLNLNVEAIDLLEAVLEKHVLNTDLWLLYAIALEQVGEYEKAGNIWIICDCVQESAFYPEYISNAAEMITEWNEKSTVRGKNPMAEQNVDGIDNPKVTVFSLTVGDPSFELSEKSILNQSTDTFKYEIIRNVAPFNEACRVMIEKSETEYFIQVDEDMILYPEAVEKMTEVIDRTPENIGMVCFHLWDVDRELKIQGIKIYRTKCLREIQWRDIKASEIDILEQFKFRNIDWILHPDIVGNHGVVYAPETIYLRYKTMYEKDMAIFNIIPNDIYRKALKFKESGNLNDLFAILGSLHGIVESSTYTDREKDFRKYNTESLEVLKRLFMSEEVPVYQKYKADKEFILKHQPLAFEKTRTVQDVIDEISGCSSLVYGKIQQQKSDQEMIDALNKIIDNTVLLHRHLLGDLQENAIAMVERIADILVDIIAYIENDAIGSFFNTYTAEFIPLFERVRQELRSLGNEPLKNN